MNTQRITARPRSEKSEALTPLPSTTYVPRTGIVKTIQRTYYFSENGRRGIRLSNITKYKDLNWLDEQCLCVTTPEGTTRPKMSFRLHLQGYDLFSKQKNVQCQRDGMLVPISVGKAAECAAQVVQLWLQSEAGFVSQRPGQDLCLDALLEIGGSLQILLGYRPSSRSHGALYSCEIVKSDAAVSPPIKRPTVHREPPAPAVSTRQAGGAAAPPTAVAATPPFHSSIAAAIPPPFVPQIGPTFPAYQTSYHHDTASVASAPSAQAVFDTNPAYGPYPHPHAQYRPPMAIHSSQAPYDSYGANTSFPQAPLVPKGHRYIVRPELYASKEHFITPFPAFTYSSATDAHGPHDSDYYPYPYLY